MAVQIQETQRKEKNPGLEYLLAGLAILAVSAPALTISVLERMGLPITNVAQSLPSVYEFLRTYAETDSMFWASFAATVAGAITAYFGPKLARAIIAND